MLGEIEGFSDDDDTNLVNKSQRSSVSEVSYEEGDDPMGIVNSSILPLPDDTEETGHEDTQQHSEIARCVANTTSQQVVDEKMEDAEEAADDSNDHEEDGIDAEEEEEEEHAGSDAESEVEESTTTAGEDAIVFHDSSETAPVVVPAISGGGTSSTRSSVNAELAQKNLPNLNQNTITAAEGTAASVPVLTPPSSQPETESQPLDMEDDEPPASPMPPRPGSPSSDSDAYGDDVYSSGSEEEPDDDEFQDDDDESESEAETTPAADSSVRQAELEYFYVAWSYNRARLLKEKEREA